MTFQFLSNSLGSSILCSIHEYLVSSLYFVASFLYTLILKPAFGFLVFAKFGYQSVLSTTALPKFISFITLLLLEPSGPCGLEKRKQISYSWLWNLSVGQHPEPSRERQYFCYRIFYCKWNVNSLLPIMPCHLYWFLPELSWTQDNRCPRGLYFYIPQVLCKLRNSHAKENQQRKARVPTVPNMGLCPPSLSVQDHFWTPEFSRPLLPPLGMFGTVPLDYHFKQFSSLCVHLFACSLVFPRRIRH